MKRQCNGWRGWATALAAGLLLGITGCSTVPITGRSQLSLISSQQELQLGLASFQEIKKGTKISQDPAANALLQKVGKRIAAATGNDLPDAQWEFVVFESAEPNAFCLPGGKVGVYTGILPITKDEAGLATVIGHEVAHAVAHHGRERISEAMVVQMGGQVANLTLNMTAPEWTSAGMLAFGVGTKLGRELPHSRTQESEADQMGLIYMARAGYDPTEAVRFWERFRDYNQAHGGDSTPSFLRTHPLDNVRIKKLQEWMPQAQAEYRAAGGAPK
jgi:predicted Zn-dependent protease